MVLSISDTRALARANAEALEVDGGTGNGYLRIYGGTPPADVTVSLSGQPVLCDVVLNDPAYDAASMVGDEAIATISTTPSVPTGTVSQTGTATFYRIFDGDDIVLRQGSISAVGNGGDLELDDTTLTADQPVRIQ